MEQVQANKPTEQVPAAAVRRARWKLFAVLAVCASPLMFSYLTYYVIKPTGRTNYGELIDPRAHPLPSCNRPASTARPPN